MRLCPHCGTQNSPELAGCSHCGKPLAPLEQTVVGYAAPARGLRGTMIGMAPPGALPPERAPSAPAPGDSQQPQPGAKAAGGLHRTMIGLAPPVPTGPKQSSDAAPTDAVAHLDFPPPPPPPEASRTQPGAAGGTVPYLSPNQKTIIGVARPGIAPLNPGQPKAQPTAPPTASPIGASPADPRPSVPLTEPLSARAAAPARRTLGDEPTPPPGIPALAAVAIVAAAALFAAAGVVWIFYHGHGSIEARASAREDGTEQLELTCAACADGTVSRLDAANATFSAHRATLPLSRPLKLGENPMTLTLVPPNGKQSFVDISVPIAFRVRGDTSGLEAPIPELRVLVNAVAGSTVTVDGKPVTLNAEGEGRHAIDVSAELTGLDPTTRTLERKVPYLVTPPNGAAQSGTVTLQAGITPLMIDAPGPAVVLDSSNFVLAGRTAKAGALTVSDRPITVDPTGRFAQMMNVSAPGETTIIVRATSKDSAPRLFPLRVKRVDSLAREAERIRQRATSNYATIAEQTAGKRGWAVALDGTVVDARTENYSTLIVMDVEGGCSHAPCFARVSYGAPFNLARGDKFSAYGQVAGVVDGPRSGTRIPEIHADFLIKANR